jgi:hypothetical protein
VLILAGLLVVAVTALAVFLGNIGSGSLLTKLKPGVAPAPSETSPATVAGDTALPNGTALDRSVAQFMEKVHKEYGDYIGFSDGTVDCEFNHDTVWLCRNYVGGMPSPTYGIIVLNDHQWRFPCEQFNFCRPGIADINSY